MSLNSTSRFLLCVLTCITALLPSAFSYSRDFRELFLNSKDHCDHVDPKKGWYTVDAGDMTSVFSVKNDVNAGFGGSCRLVFHTSRRDGRVCVMQRRLKFDTFAVTLKLFDRWVDSNPGDEAEPSKILTKAQALGSVEWCTSGRYLTIVMSQSGPKPSMRKVDVDLLVYDLQSCHREVSMDHLPSCGSTLLLDKSRVKVTNFDPHRKVKGIFQKCSLTFEYVGHEVTRSLCLVFEPRHDVNQDCSLLNYSINIYSYHAELKEFSGERTCENPAPRNWCSNGTKISLELSRGNNYAAENTVVFTALVLDHEGGPKTLPQVVQASRSPDSSDQGGVIAAVVVVVVVVIIIVVVVVVVVLYRRRRRPIENREGETQKRAENKLYTNVLQAL